MTRLEHDNTRPTVLIVVFNEVSNDPRVMRHVSALRGHYRLVSCGFGDAPEGVSEHIRLNPRPGNRFKRLRGLHRLALQQFDDYYWSDPLHQEARDKIVELEFDAVMANDIDALPVASEASGGKPVVADLHEYAPRLREDSWTWNLAKSRYVKSLCSRYLPEADLRITVADSLAREYEDEFGLPFETITNAAPWRRPEPRPTSNPLRIVHSGGATPNRRLEVMIEGVSRVRGVLFDLYLVPAGNPKYLERLKGLAETTSNVRILDPVPMSELPATHDNYDVGLYVLAPTGFNTRYALPNKFFDFVQSGLAVVVGPSPEMAARVSMNGLGMVLPDFSADSLSAGLTGVTRDQVEQWKRATCHSAVGMSAESEALKLRRLMATLVS